MPAFFFDPKDGDDISSETSVELQRTTRRYVPVDMAPLSWYPYWLGSLDIIQIFDSSPSLCGLSYVKHLRNYIKTKGTDWFGDNALDVYLGGSRFKSRPGHRKCWGFSFPSVPPGKFRDDATIRQWPLPSKSFYNSWFIHHSIVRHYLVFVLKAL
jgi:hypothetical protein